LGYPMPENRRYGTIFMDILARTDLIASAKLIYIVLGHRIRDNEDCWPGTRCLSKDIGMSRGAVQRGIECLEKAELIAIDRRVNGSTNHYRILKADPKQDRLAGPETIPPLFQNESTGGSETAQRVDPKQSHNNLREVAKGNNTKNKPPSARELSADKIVKAYIALIDRPADSNTAQTRKNVMKLLKAGHTESQLLEYAENYANSAAGAADKEYRFKASNFYGRKAEWEAFTDKPASSNTIGSKHVDAYGEPLEATA
jgi:hypothetical protein